MRTMKTFAFMALTSVLMMVPTIVPAADETINSQVARQKEVDDGGSGRYRAIVVSEKTLQHFTIYRPRNVKYAARREGPLPILIWCNGACSGSNTGYERMLNEIASHGYVVVGLGAFRMVDSDPGDDGSSEQMVVEAINWLVKQAKQRTSDYYKAIDVNNIALSGHSCGGAQAIANCANSRVKTLLIMNAGMGGMSMGGATPRSLNSLHCPIIYMTGGTDDVAYGNAKVDFENVKKQAVWADLKNAGHGGTYWDKYGGEFGRLAVKWMDWHLKGHQQNARLFLKPDLTGYSSNWEVKSRNFSTKEKRYDAAFEEEGETLTDTLFNRAEVDSLFDFGVDISALNTLTGKNLTFYNRDGQKKNLLPLLKELGVNSVRLRVMVNPTNDTYSLSYAKTLANSAKSQNFGIMLDLHYCDWWGDNVKPKAWSSHTADKLLTDVKNHTTTAVRNMNGTRKLRWVQIGNEIDYGLLQEKGQTTSDFVNIINTAYEAIKKVNANVQAVLHVAECENTQSLIAFFDTLQAHGAQWDAIGLSVHVKGSSLTPDKLIERVVENVRTLRERYDKKVLVVETGYYVDRPLEANQWLCSFILQLMDAGASGLYYWEPELTEDYELGAWNPRSRKPTLTLDAFNGVRHSDGTDNIHGQPADTPSHATTYYTIVGTRLARPQRGVNIVRTAEGKTRKILVR